MENITIDIPLECCPFCGGEIKTVKKHVSEKHQRCYYQIACDNIRCAIKPHTIAYSDLDYIIECWNTRKEKNK